MESKADAKNSKTGEKSKSKGQCTSEFIPSPMMSPSLKAAERENLTGSEGRVFTFEESAKSFNKKSLESTVYKMTDSYQTQLVYMQQYINYLKTKLDQVEQKPAVKSAENQKLLEEIEQLKAAIQEKNAESNNYLDELCEKQDQIFKLSQRLSDLQEDRQETIEKSIRKEEEVVFVEQELRKFYSKKINGFESVLKELKNELDLKDRELNYMICENKNNLKNLADLRDGLYDKIDRTSQINEKDFKGLEEKVATAEDKLYSLSKTLRSLENSAMFPTKNKLKVLEEELTEKYEKIVNDQKDITEKLKENLEARESEMKCLIESFEKTRKLLEKKEEDLKREAKINQEYSKKKNDLEKELDRISVLFENEKIEKSLVLKKSEELNKNLTLTERIVDELKSESEVLKEKLSESEGKNLVNSNKITEQLSEILHLQSRVAEKKIKIRERKETIVEKHKKIEEIQEDYQQLQLELEDLNKELAVRDLENISLKKSELEKSKKIAELDSSLIGQVCELEELNEKIRNYQAKLIKETQENQEYLHQTLKQNNQIVALQNEKIELSSTIEIKEKHVEEALLKHSDALIQLEKSKRKLKESKENLKKLEFIIKEQSNNFIVLSKEKKVIDDDLIEYKAQLKYLESTQLDTLKALSESQLQVKQLTTQIQKLDLTIEDSKISIIKLNEEHKSKIESLHQSKLNELEEAKSNFDMEKDSLLDKLKKLESFSLELNYRNSELLEKNKDLINELKNFKEKTMQNEINMTKTQFVLTEENNSLKSIESNLRKEISVLNIINSELIHQVKAYESEFLKLESENFELVKMLEEKQSEFQIYSEKNKSTVENLENTIEKNKILIGDLEFSKKQIIEKLSLSLEKSDDHERELLSHIEDLQVTKKDLQRKVNEMSLEIQEKQKIFSENELKFESELQEISKKLIEKNMEISKLSECVRLKEAQEISLKSEMLQAKNTDFEKLRQINKFSIEVEFLKEKINDQTESKRILTEKLNQAEDELRNSVEENRKLIEKLSKSETNLTESKMTLIELTKKNTSDFEVLEKQLLESESKSQFSQSYLNRLKEELSLEKKGKTDLLTNYKQKETDLEIKLQSLINSNSELKLRFDSTLVNLEKIQEDCKEAKNKLEKAYQKENDYKQIIEKLVKEHQEKIESLNIVHKHQFDSLQIEISNLKLDLNKASFKSDSLLEEIENFHKREENIKSENLDLQKQIEKNEKASKIILDFKQSECEKLEKQVEIFRDQWLAVSEKRDSGDSLSSSFKKILNEKENYIKGLVSRIKDNENKIFELEYARENLENTIRGLKNGGGSERSLRY